MRIAYALTHPIQYQAPLIRHLRAGGIDLEVIYATDITARGYKDAGFGTRVTWDVPLLEGYPHRVLFPGDPLPSGLREFRRYRRALTAALEDIKPDAVWVHGWGNSFPLAALRAARLQNLPVLMRGETYLDCLHGGKMRRTLHAMVLSLLFRSVSQFLAIGSANREYYRCHGVPDERIHLAPYAVDNAFFQARCREAAPRRQALRAELGIEPGRPVILFCAKLIPVKDPATLIRAVGRMVEANPVLLLAGDGELRPSLEKLAAEVAPGLVKFLGFRNQTELPAFYDLCDLFVLPSVFEPWGLVVNEVMNAAKPVIVSDKIGSGHDLVQPGINGDVFPAGDVEALAAKMRPWLLDAALRASGGAESLRLINHWSFEENLAGMRQAVEALQHPASHA
jgi:glycosyltransferase involved in cell wall biosynthesis